MEMGEKVGGNKKEKYNLGLGLKLKRGILIGKRGGNTTPSLSWRFEFAEEETEDYEVKGVSARKLAAELWEAQPHLTVAKGGRSAQPQELESKRFELLNHRFDEPFESTPQDQPTTTNNMIKHTTESLRSNRSVERGGNDLPSVSPRRSGSMEMIPCRREINPTGSLKYKGKFRESSHGVKTSTELLRVLNRIWSLEEQHMSNTSLVDTMRKELDQARTHIKLLLKEKKRYHLEIQDLTKQLAEECVVRKDKEQSQVQETIHSMWQELDDERKMRKHSESLLRKLGLELSEAQSCFSKAYNELERVRKARKLLEDLCDEFAKGIRDYEQEMRVMKRKPEKDFTTVKDTDRLILHISEAWIDERMQMKLEESRSGLDDTRTVLDKLSPEIETFLQARKSGPLPNKRVSSSKKPTRPSMESFHLNEAGSAPWIGNDKEDSVDSEVKRDSIRKRWNGTEKQRDHSLPFECEKHHQEIFLNPSSSQYPVERWTSKVRIPDVIASESSSRLPPGVKENTLKARLLEARLESQQSRSRGP